MIDGFSISGYRSFGPSEVQISDLSKVNVFIGKNNCGKSNILRFINILDDLTRQRAHSEPAAKLDPLLDFCLTDSSRKVILGFQIKHDSYTANLFEPVVKPFGSAWARLFPEMAECFWFHFKVGAKIEPTEESLSLFKELILIRCSHAETNDLTRTLCNYTQGSPEKRATDISAALHRMVTPRFDCRFIGAFRRISESGSQPLSGGGLIKELRRLQSPELANYAQARQRFTQIVEFVREILGEPDALLEIPAEKDEIYVSIKKKVLPLDSLGTGIHELIIMAAAVTLVDGVLFCIEEPEIHLHPELQKKFTQYIANNTQNQYLIASHSNAFFDLPGVNIYGCNLVDNHTGCRLVSSAAEKHAVLMDLGYRPSDLLQANYIIWVEGPSDRVYINHWIKAKAPSLVEGLHYAIMFYGGRLLSHLSYDDPLVDDFIRLSCLNRNACIVVDSDRKTAHSPINETKRRVVKDFQSYGCLAWVTKGRTIENYIPEPVLNQAIVKVHPKTHCPLNWERFADLTRIRQDKIIDKVAVARAATESKADFSMLELDNIIKALIDRIRKYNT
jgi:hypothetical protein